MVTVERNQRSRKGPAQAGARLAQRLIKAFELGELDRPLVPGMGNRFAEQA